MPANPKIRKTFFFVLGTAAFLLVLPFLLPLALPFLIGLCVALLAEPLVRALQDKAKLPRWLSSILCVGGILALFGTVLYFLLRVLFGELTEFSRQMPELLLQLEAPIRQIRLWLERLVSRLPMRTAQALNRQITELFSGSSYLMQTLSRRLVALVSGVLSKMPGALIGTVTTLLAAFFTSSSLPDLKIYLEKKMTEARHGKFKTFSCRIKKTLGCWLLAQLELTGISCAVLCVGLAILRVDFWLLFGVLIALIDALPVLGAGVVLIPWALLSFLQADSALGIGLLILCGCVTVLRSALEPKLIGQKFGLHPLISLAAFYVGWRVMGTAGMILFPIATVLTGQIYSVLRPEQKPQIHGNETPNRTDSRKSAPSPVPTLQQSSKKQTEI